MNIEDTQDLRKYLQDQGVLSAGAELQSEVLTGGVSNHTMKIDFNGNSWVMKQALPKLRVKGDWFSEPERIYHEAEAIRWFEQNMPGTCPRLTFEDRAHFIIAMEAVSMPFHNLKDLFMNAAPLAEHFIQAGKIVRSHTYIGH